MKYILVIQFLEELAKDIEWIANIEDILDEHLSEAEVDGHDIGSGEINIFIFTHSPIDTFKIVKNLLAENSLLSAAKIAYREINDNNYICMWPEDLTEFEVI